MTPRTARLVVALVALAAATTAPTLVAAPAAALPSAAARSEGVIAGAWIVTLKAGASPDRVADDHRRNEGAQIDQLYRYALNGYAARMSDAAAARISRDSRVAAVEPDRVVTVERPAAKPGGGTQPVTQPDQTLPTGITRIGTRADTRTTSVGSGVDVAVIDTGIDTDHPDLDVTPGKNCIRSGSTDDGNGHGTHVAGTIGALDNGIGVVGVAPGVQLWAVRVLDNRGSGTTSSVICGVDWVAQQNLAGNTIEVANMSLGGGGSDPEHGANGDCSTGNGYHDAICKTVGLGTTFAVAAGNSSADAGASVPAAFDEVITVSALADFDGLPGGTAPAGCRVDADDTFADFSNHGPDVDLIAPGVCILSTWKDGGYSTISGTSMASPHVAGAAALYLASHSGAAPSAVQAALRDAGSDKWSNADDRDAVKEPLLDVSTF